MAGEAFGGSHSETHPSAPSRRALLAMGGAAATAAAIAACSKPVAGAGVQHSGTSRPTASRPGKPTIDQWYHQYGEAGTQEAVERYAAAYPAATVKVTWQSGEYDQSTATALRTDAGPDVFEYGNGPTIDMIKDGQVVDLTDILGTVRDDFQPSLLGRMSWDGKVWGVPQVVDTQLLVYRKSMFAAARVKPPETFDDLLAAAEKLTKRGVKGLFLGNDGGARLMGGPMLWSAGLDYLTDDNKVGFDNARGAKALGRLRELWEAEVLLLDAPKDWYDASAIVSGLTAMQFTGLWTFPDLTKGLGDDFGVLPWPALDDMGNRSVPVGAYGSCVSAKAQNVSAAKKFVKWLWVDQTAHQLDFATAYGFHIPARASLIDKAASLKSGVAAEAASIALEFGQAQTSMLWTAKSNAAFGDAMTRIVTDGADPAKQIATVKQVANAELKRVLA